MRRFSPVGQMVLLATAACSGPGSPVHAGEVSPSESREAGASGTEVPRGTGSLPVSNPGPQPFYPRTDLPFGTVVAADLHAEVLGVAQDADALYYSDFTDVQGGQWALHRVAKSGATPPQTLAVVETQDFIAVDDSFVYFAEPSGSMDRVPKQGGAIELMASALGMPAGIAVDTSALYWADLDSDASTSGGIWTMPKSGGTPILAASVAPTRFIVTDGTGPIAWDNDQGVFWSGSARAAVTEIQTGEANYFAPVMAGGGVFWASMQHAGADAGMVVPTFCAWFGDGDAQTSGTVTIPFVPSPAYGTGTELTSGAGEAFTADGQSMYWAYGGAIFRASVATRSIDQVASRAPTETSPSCLVTETALPFLLVDAHSVYAFEFWVDCNGLHGDIRSTAK
jgi:hypothetical protein